jgi:hypothetical protein
MHNKGERTMKCTKAQDFYFANRDGLLNEADRLQLAEHLTRCSACAEFFKEMDASLALLSKLPEMSPSEGFEWNVKRRIHAERNRMLRSERRAPFREGRWMMRFAVGAAAAAVVLAGVFAMGRFTAPGPSVRALDGAERAAARYSPSSVEQSAFEYMPSGGFTGPRMVSDNVFSISRRPEGAEQSPFKFVAGSREDSLMRENELLRRRIENLERQVLYLKNVIERERAQRINLSLP